MDVVSSLRTLWRFRVVVAVLAAVALIIGLATAYRIQGPTSFQSRGYEVGIASAQALVDTPSSQVADLGSEDTASVDIATLSTRAGLLANLMTTSPMKDEIAARAGIAPDQLIAVPPATAAPGGADAAAPGVKVTADNRKASILRVTIPELQSGQIPILSVRTQAPDEKTAGRLATESIAVLEQQLASRADDDKVPAGRRVVVRPLGGAQTSLEARGASKSMAIAAAIGFLLFGCAALLGVVALANGWRAAGEQERAELRPVPEYDDEEDDLGDLGGEPGLAPLELPPLPQRGWRDDEPALPEDPKAAEHLR
jgi:hypothetical protein